jgi:hypothetical protein
MKKQTKIVRRRKWWGIFDERGIPWSAHVAKSAAVYDAAELSAMNRDGEDFTVRSVWVEWKVSK